mmetsp:Transcript_35409/g.92610  ORF Transcript_35409/g.92610 Transcript_35409/m.92610 type:complete len:214 (-) Transcript_35409:403-1044(-)
MLGVSNAWSPATPSANTIHICDVRDSPLEPAKATVPRRRGCSQGLGRSSLMVELPNLCCRVLLWETPNCARKPFTARKMLVPLKNPCFTSSRKCPDPIGAQSVRTVMLNSPRTCRSFLSSSAVWTALPERRPKRHLTCTTSSGFLPGSGGQGGFLDFTQKMSTSFASGASLMNTMLEAAFFPLNGFSLFGGSLGKPFSGGFFPMARLFMSDTS